MSPYLVWCISKQKKNIGQFRKPTTEERGTVFIRQIYQIISKYYPKLFELMNKLPDKRKGSTYDMSEIVTGCIAMFIFKETSRNAFNNDIKETRFRDNYKKIFRKGLPHMDSVDHVIRDIAPKDLERIKTAFVAALVEQRLFKQFKLFDKYYMIAIDGTGLYSLEKDNAEQNLPHKTSKNGIVSYQLHVVEAKLVTASGFSISIASEFVTNQPGDGEADKEFVKQDCEQKAFVRLATKIKAAYPRLPICILADGLYPNQTFMSICEKNKWAYVVVLKDKSLKTLQEEVTDIEQKHTRRTIHSYCIDKGKTYIQHKYEWISEPLTYAGHTVYWLSCTETEIRYGKDGKRLPPKDATTNDTTRFVNLTSTPVNNENVRDITNAGRRRWKIENQGFNTQKNHGYNLEHQYSRTSFDAQQNYYECMQIAHTINQLVEKSKDLANLLAQDNKLTIKHLCKQLLSWFTIGTLDMTEIELDIRIQIRLAG